MKKIILGFALAVSLVTTACSNQYRTTSVEPSEDEVFAAYDELNTNSTDTSLLEDLRQDTSSTVYFSQSGVFGSPYSVFSFGDVGFLGDAFGQSTSGLSVLDLDLKTATVVFLDAMDSSGQRHFALMLKLENSAGTTKYFSATTTEYGFSKTNFEVGFDLGSGSYLVLRSNDVSTQYSDELAGAIQLKAFIQQGNSEYPVGQFSILKGYGGV